MALYWIEDSAGRVLGPVQLDIVRELIAAGRITNVSRLSKDGQTFLPIAQVPEAASALAPAGGASREAAEKQKAAQLRAQLQGLRARSAHEVFGVKADASLDEYRNAFFALVKRFHPSRVPPGAHASLREACLEAFQFLSELMAQVDGSRTTPPAVEALPPPIPSLQSRLRPAIVPSPTYGLDEFVGLTQGKRGLDARVRVSVRTLDIFTEHHTVNLKNDGVFLPSKENLPLGTLLNMHFVFEPLAEITRRELDTRGKVVWENAGLRGKTKPGFGVRLITLNKAEREFIREYVKSAPPPAPQDAA